MDDVYYSGAVLLLLIIILRVFVRLCFNYCQKNDGCKSKNSRRTQQAANNIRDRRNRSPNNNTEIFVINLSDNNNEVIEIEPPLYDDLIEELPPIYEEAIRLPPLVEPNEGQSN